MTANRLNALISIVHKTASPHVQVTLETLDEWVDPAIPLHPLFPLLSAVHKTDHSRCYFMHVHGGGGGHTEVEPHGIAQVGGEPEEEMKSNFHNVIGVCSMIAKPQTEFTSGWFQAVSKKIDENAELLGKIFHPLSYTNSERILHSDIAPSFSDYRWIHRHAVRRNPCRQSIQRTTHTALLANRTFLKVAY